MSGKRGLVYTLLGVSFMAVGVAAEMLSQFLSGEVAGVLLLFGAVGTVGGTVGLLGILFGTYGASLEADASRLAADSREITVKKIPGMLKYSGGHEVLFVPFSEDGHGPVLYLDSAYCSRFDWVEGWQLFRHQVLLRVLRTEPSSKRWTLRFGFDIWAATVGPWSYAWRSRKQEKLQ